MKEGEGEWGCEKEKQQEGGQKHRKKQGQGERERGGTCALGHTAPLGMVLVGMLFFVDCAPNAWALEPILIYPPQKKTTLKTKTGAFENNF